MQQQQFIPQQQNLMHVMISMADVEYRVTLDRIKTTVLNFFGVTEDGFSSKSRKHELVIARTYCAVLCKKIIPLESLSSIGKAMGGRDHSTVISCIKRFRDYMDTEPKTKLYYENIKAMILREELPHPNYTQYIPEKPVAEIVSEMEASEMTFHLEDDVEETILEHKADNHYSYNREKSYQ